MISRRQSQLQWSNSKQQWMLFISLINSDMNFEFQSFVRKFVELSEQGYNAKLCAESEAGKVSVSLHLDLRQSSPNVPHFNTSGKKSGGQPARWRRHERRAAMRLAATKEADVVGEQPIEVADVVDETSAEEAVVGNNTEEVTSGRETENNAPVGEEPTECQEDVPESWEDLMGEEPMESQAVVEGIPAETIEALYTSPLFRNVVGIRPVNENGVLLDQNTENIVTLTPRSRLRDALLPVFTQAVMSPPCFRPPIQTSRSPIQTSRSTVQAFRPPI